MFALHINNASTLPSETKYVFFCENSNAGKAKLNKFYLLTLISVTEKMQLSDFDIALWQIKSGKRVPNFIRIGLVL